MTRILLVETASSKRIFDKVEQIRNAGVYPDPEITILCRADHCDAFAKLSGVEIYSMQRDARRRALSELNQKKFDIAFVFWTGETQYRRMKLSALRLKAGEIFVVGGDGSEFRLTWKAICRHAAFRSRHPLPTDHWDVIRSQQARDQVLIIQSAEPAYVLQGLDRLKEKPLFANPRYTLFCRNNPDAVRSFEKHPMIEKVINHSEARGSWRHLQSLRHIEFDAIVLFMTGDPSYRKIKLFAFLLGVPLRKMLIFNEAIDCFFFSWNPWLSLVLHRIQEQPPSGALSRGTDSLRMLLSFGLKLALLPFRFLWLLVVWLRLRFIGWRSLRKGHDYSF